VNPKGRSSRYYVKGTEGVELACSLCQIVLQVAYTPGDEFPQHRCAGTNRPRKFDLVLQLDAVEDSKRIDSFWYGDYMSTDF